MVLVIWAIRPMLKNDSLETMAPMIRPHQNKLNKSDWTFVVLILLYVLYALLFIESTSVRIGGQKYYCLFDDSMISMTYAKNLATGHGLVYNPGEARVEGYSNLLWVLFMAAIHFLKPGLAYSSLFIQVSELLLVVLSLYFVRKIAKKISGSESVALSAVFLTAFYFPINNWALQGMDVGPVMFILSIAIYQALSCVESNRVSLWLFIVLGIGTLLRIDFFVFFLVIASFLILSLKNQKKIAILYSIGTALFFLGGQTLFRVLYYREWLPNTYYLKMTGTPLVVRALTGLTSTVGLMGDLTLVIVCLPFIYIVFHRNSYRVQLLFLIIFVTLFYNIYVGGDAWDWYGGANRYWAVIMPFFFILVASPIHDLLILLRSKLSKFGFPKESLFNAGYVAAILAIFLVIHAAPYRGHLGGLILQEPVLHYDEHVYSLAMSRFLKDIATTDATIGGTIAGTIKYFTGNTFIDFLGKNDRYIAKARPRWGTTIEDYYKFRPGHNKCDGAYSVRVLQPDVILNLWCDQLELRDYLREKYTNLGLIRRGEVYLKKDSAHIRWDKYNLSNKKMIGRYFNPPTTQFSFYSIGTIDLQIDKPTRPH